MEINNENRSSQFETKVNVRIREIDPMTHHVLNEVLGSNRVTKLALMGIIKLINGEFTPSAPDFHNSITRYIPLYLALGSNDSSSTSAGVGSIVSVNDYKLLSEFTNDTTGKKMRVKLSSNNKISNRDNDQYIRLTINEYIQSNLFDGKNIGELGLFTDEFNNTCWARIALNKKILKNAGSVLDITWEITVISLESENNPYDNTWSIKENLNNTVARALKFTDGSKYDQTLWNNFQKELVLSNAVLSYSQATKEIIDERNKNLTDYITQLKKIYDQE